MSLLFPNDKLSALEPQRGQGNGGAFGVGQLTPALGAAPPPKRAGHHRLRGRQHDEAVASWIHVVPPSTLTTKDGAVPLAPLGA